MTRIKTILISPTNACNFKCAHCGLKKTGRNYLIPFSTVEKVFNEASKMSIQNLEITGGEPLLFYEMTFKIIELAKKKGLNVILNTNGYFIAYPNSKESIKKLKSIDKIIFSVDYDHLKFISYSSLLYAIKKVLNSSINLQINIANRKETVHENLLLLQKLTKDLNGRLMQTTPLIKFTNLSLVYYYDTFCHFFIFCKKSKKIIPIGIINVAKTDANKGKIKNPNSMKLIRVIFSSCRNFTPYVDFNSNLFPCCSYYCINNPKYYSINKAIKDENIFRISDPLLKIIIHDCFPFLKIFLRIKKDKKLLKIFLKKKYYMPCDFCLEVQKYKKQILKIDPPSIFEIIGFSIFNFHYFLVSNLNFVIWKLFSLIRKFIMVISLL